MANNTLIGITNLLATATLKNGTGGGAPALDETSPYTMAKTQTSDRSSVWKTADPPSASPLNVDFDLGSNKTVTAAAILGYRTSAGLAASSLKIYSAPSSAGYVPAAWTLQGTISSISGNPRDAGVVFSSVSQRYWRFEFTHAGNAWSAGRLWLGNPTDLGLIHTPGGVDRPFANRLETPQPNGAIVINALGDPGRDFSLPFASQDSSLRDTLQNLHTQTGSIIYVDSEARFFECIVKGGAVPASRPWNTLYDLQLELTRLP